MILLSCLNENKPCRAGPPKTDGSWWRGLTECGPLEKGMATHSHILAWGTPWTEEPGGLQCMGLQLSMHAAKSNPMLHSPWNELMT